MSPHIINTQEEFMEKAYQDNKLYPHRAIKHHWLPNMLLKDYQIPKKRTKKPSKMGFRIIMANPNSHSNKYKIIKNTSSNNFNSINNFTSNYSLVNVVRNNRKYIVSSPSFAHQKVNGGGYYSSELEKYYSIIEETFKLLEINETKDASKEKVELDLLLAHSLISRNPLASNSVRTLEDLSKHFKNFMNNTYYYNSITLKEETPLFPFLSEIPFTHNNLDFMATVVSSKRIFIRLLKSKDNSISIMEDDLDFCEIEKAYLKKVKDLVKDNIFIIPTSKYNNF